MPPAFDQPILVLLRAEGREPGNPGADAPPRRVVFEVSVLRQPPDGPPVAARRRPHRPSSGSQVDAIDGAGGHPPGAENQRAASRAPDLSLSSQGLGDRASRSCLVRRHHLHPGSARLPLPGRDHGLGDAPRPVLAALEHHGCLLLRRGAERRAGPLRQPGDLQHRPGKPVHQPRLHRRAQGRGRRDLHGRAGPLHGQPRFAPIPTGCHRAPVALAQIRSGLPARADRRLRGAAGHR